MAKKKRLALVLEGGGFRGVYTSGVLDVLMEHGVYGFDDIWGTSAGALNGANYKAHMVGRQIRISLAFRDDKRMMSLTSLIHTGSMLGREFLFDDVQNYYDPFDYEMFKKNKTRLWACATDLLFGTPTYFQVKELPQDTKPLMATSALPLITDSVEIDKELYVDGGTADSVPVEVALGLDKKYAPETKDYHPADKALVVLTQPRDYKKGPMKEAIMAPYRRKYAEYPYFVEAYETRPDRYNAEYEHCFELEEEKKIFLIAPERDLDLGIAETSGEKLLAAYMMGRKQALENLDAICEFLGIEHN